MASTAAKLIDREDSNEFAALLKESLGGSTKFEGNVVTGTVVGLTDDFVIVDVGLKSFPNFRKIKSRLNR